MLPIPTIRPTRVEIDRSAVRHNLRLLRAAAGRAQVIPVVKANAYGHGAAIVAPVLAEEGVDMMAVALVEEALDLRRAGIRAPLLVLGLGGNYDGSEDFLFSENLRPMVHRTDQVQPLGEAARRRKQKLSVHLKIDTGMGRIGVPWDRCDLLLDEVAKYSELWVEGVSTHFANADLVDPGVTRQQLNRFQTALARVKARGFQPSLCHLANSAGTLTLSPEEMGPGINAVRPGIALYGLSPAAWMTEAADLQPVLSWKTQIVALKRVSAGTPISYGGTWTASSESLIATLPVGYADGYSRHHSNLGHVLVQGQRAPIVGRVCMDMCMADVTRIPQAKVRDDVVLLGKQGDAQISAGQLAEWSHTIHYEVICGIGARVPRVAVGT